MRIRVHGTRKLDFISNGEKVQGTQIFYSRPYDGVIGELTDKLFVRKDFPLPADLAPGKYCDIFCDTKGHIEHLQIVNTTDGK